MRLSIFLFVITSVFFSENAYSQIHCGTHGKNKYIAQEKFMPGYFGCNYINKTNRTLSITVHIAQDSLGNTAYNEANLAEPVEYANALFAPIGLSFQICEIREMENFQFNDLVSAEELDDMTATYYQQNTINLYILNSIDHYDYGIVEGFGALPGGQDIVAVTKAWMTGESKVFVHELGHYFGLYHTFETDFGNELVDGSNCETTGDLVCDTEADPTDDGDHAPFPDCNYEGPIDFDANGEFYVPPTNNIMSYYSYDCICRFTPQQYNRMLEQYQSFRTNLW